MIVTEWNVSEKKIYETGIDRGMLIIDDPNTPGTPLSVPWEGLMSVAESPGGAEPTDLYANNEKYLTIMSKETFGGTIEAYTFPPEFSLCDGAYAVAEGVKAAQQTRKMFSLAYRTLVGNEVDGDEHGYKYHIIYDCLASPSERTNATVGEKTEAMTMSWEFTTTPVQLVDHKATSKLSFDSRTMNAGSLAMLEEMLFGDDDVAAIYPLPTMLEPNELLAMLEAAVI